MQPLFSYAGKCIGYLADDRLFRQDGKQIGRVVADAVYSARGGYIGTIASNRIGRKPGKAHSIQAGFVPVRIMPQPRQANRQPVPLSPGMHDIVADSLGSSSPRPPHNPADKRYARPRPCQAAPKASGIDKPCGRS